MKKHALIFTTALAGLLLLSHPVIAQVPASNPDIPITAGNATYARNVNCDMITTGGGLLRAIAYDDHNTYNSTVYLEDFTGASVTIAIANGVDIDVVLGDDMSNPGNDYIVTVVYNSFGNPILESYQITGVGSASLSASMIATFPLPLTTGPCYNAPHLDMYPDPFNLINGIPSLHEFAVIWTEYQPGIGSDCFMINADNASLTPLAATYQVTSGGMGNWPDVACLWHYGTNEPFAYVASNTGGNIDLWEANLTTTANGVIVPALNAGVSVFKNVRIEAMNAYDPAAGIQKYEIAYAVYAGPGMTDMMSYNDLTFNTNLSTSVPLPPGYNMHPAVSAGPGQMLGGGYGNENHSVCWYNESTPFYQSMAIQANTGNPLYPFYFEVNQNPTWAMNANFYDAPIAVSTSSNAGQNELLTAWNRDNDIYFKYQGDITQYKPTNVKSVSAKTYRLYPNPASTAITVDGISQGTYTITDVTGRMLLQGNLVKAGSTINIETLVSGMYIATIIENGKTSVLKFVKN